jgi:hypothetical protein
VQPISRQTRCAIAPDPRDKLGSKHVYVHDTKGTNRAVIIGMEILHENIDCGAVNYKVKHKDTCTYMHRIKEKEGAGAYASLFLTRLLIVILSSLFTFL